MATINLSNGYNSNSDKDFGINPPAVFFNLLQSPYEFIPGKTFIDNNGNGNYDEGIDNAIDTAAIKRGPYLGEEAIPGAKNLGMTSFYAEFKSNPTLGGPCNAIQARNLLLGGLFYNGDSIKVKTLTFGNGKSLGSLAN